MSISINDVKLSQYIDPEVWQNEKRLKELFTYFSNMLDRREQSSAWLWSDGSPLYTWINELYEGYSEVDEATGETIEISEETEKIEIETAVRALSVVELKESFDMLAWYVDDRFH